MASGPAQPRLSFIDLVLHDLSIEIPMFVQRRADEGDDRSFVIQFGEDGRCRVRLPDISDPRSVERSVAEAQAHLSRLAGRAVPRCPVEGHAHGLAFRAEPGTPHWSCPTGGWICRLGEYEERSWPQVGVSLAPLLAARLKRRGLDGEWQGLAVRSRPSGHVAEIRVAHRTDALVAAMAAAAAPLQVEVDEVQAPPPRRV